MKKLVLFAVLLLSSCEKKFVYPNDVRVVEVEGMGCSLCEHAVEIAVFNVKGVKWVYADKDRCDLQIKFDEGYDLERVLSDVTKAIESANHGSETYRMRGIIK